MGILFLFHTPSESDNFFHKIGAVLYLFYSKSDKIFISQPLHVQ